VFAAATGLPTAANGSVFEVPLDQTMSGVAVRTGQATVETHASEQEDDATELLRKLGVRTFVCIPMIVGGRVIGALSLAHPGAVPHVHDMVPWLHSLANFVASLIERKRAEEERLVLLREQSARAQAEAAIQARDEFLSIATHELKTPVAALSAYVQLLTRRYERAELNPRQIREALGVLAERTNKLAHLMAQLLEVSRIDGGKLMIEVEPCDLVPLVRGVVATTQALTDRHVLRLQAPERAMAAVDPMRIEQVVTNLLGNAVHYSPDGGSIEVEIGDRTDGAVVVAVRDHGIGIPPEHHERVFERYYQAQSNQRGGMGLGLYVSAQIVQQHGGRLDVESPPDGGTRIILRLPRGPAA
jgi:signal transduction histidine kinase